MNDLLDNNSENEIPDAKRHIRSAFYWVGLGLIIVGVLFKIQHWNNSRELIIGGVIASFVYYIWSFFDRR